MNPARARTTETQFQIFDCNSRETEYLFLLNLRKGSLRSRGQDEIRHEKEKHVLREIEGLLGDQLRPFRDFNKGSL